MDNVAVSATRPQPLPNADAIARSHSHTGNNWHLTALVHHMANANSDIEFGFARKVRSPRLYERHTWTMAAVMNNFAGDGNVDLKPEKAHILSATFEWHAADRNWGVKAGPDYTAVVDYIDAIRCVTGAACTAANRTTTKQFVTRQYTNQSARFYGFDLSGYMPLAKSDLSQLGFTGLLNCTNGKNRDTGDDLYTIMPLNPRLALTHNLGGWESAVERVSVKGKDALSDVRNKVRTAGYSLTNLRTSYSGKQLPPISASRTFSTRPTPCRWAVPTSVRAGQCRSIRQPAMPCLAGVTRFPAWAARSTWVSTSGSSAKPQIKPRPMAGSIFRGALKCACFRPSTAARR